MLELQNISVCVESSREILKNINLTIEDSKFIVITGPNGGGKSTLAKVIAGILPPSSGRILFDGKDITDASITERAKMGIGYAFQQPVRFKGITVRDLITLAAGTQLKEQEIRAYLRDVGLCAREYIDREVKRIEIAMAIARKTPLTLFDEPEAGIDLWSFQNLIDVFKRMRKEIQGSVLIISHQERILDIADDIVVLSGGEVTARGAKEKLLPELLQAEGGCNFCCGKGGNEDE